MNVHLANWSLYFFLLLISSIINSQFCIYEKLPWIHIKFKLINLLHFGKKVGILSYFYSAISAFNTPSPHPFATALYICNARKIRLSILLVKIFDQFKFQPPVQSFFNQILILYFYIICLGIVLFHEMKWNRWDVF